MQVSYKINPFISTHVYKTEKKIRAVLENVVEKEYLEFEDDTAVLWDAMLKKSYFSSLQLSEELNKPEVEIKKFLNELVEINILSSSQNQKKERNIIL